MGKNNYRTQGKASRQSYLSRQPAPRGTLPLKAYGKLKRFADITDNNALAYDRHLKERGLKAKTRWNNCHRFLNSFILDAIAEGLMDRNQYRWIRLDKGSDSEALRKQLTLNELKQLALSTIPTHSLEKIRDAFAFQALTCLSYSDLKDFDTSSIITSNGMKAYAGKQNKTGQRFLVPLLPHALEHLDKYNGKIPLISNAKYNMYLKAVAQAAGIDKPVSSHRARHTGATLLLNKGAPLGIVSKILGHSSTRITEQVYADTLDETIAEAARKDVT